jgi:hypothetical protein
MATRTQEQWEHCREEQFAALCAFYEVSWEWKTHSANPSINRFVDEIALYFRFDGKDYAECAPCDTPALREMLAEMMTRALLCVVYGKTPDQLDEGDTAHRVQMVKDFAAHERAATATRDLAQK